MKISPLTIFVGWLAIAMITLTYGFSKRAPIMEEVANYIKYRDGMIQQQKLWPQAVKKVNDATTLGKKEVAEWQQISSSQTLPAPPMAGSIDLSMDDEHLAEHIVDYRNQLQEMLNNQVKAGGVTVIQGPVIPPPPTTGDQIVSTYFHFPPQTAPVLVFDLGSVTVQGTFAQISENMKAWSRMPHFLAVADGLRMQGTAPKLTATYQVSIVGFVAVPSTKYIFPPMPDGAHLVTAAVAAPVGTNIAGANPQAQAQAKALLNQAVKQNPGAAAQAAKQLQKTNPAAAAQIQGAINAQKGAAPKGGPGAKPAPPAGKPGVPGAKPGAIPPVKPGAAVAKPGAAGAKPAGAARTGQRSGG